MVGRPNPAWRYLIALGAAYLLVAQLLIVGVSTGLQIELDNAGHNITLCAPSGQPADNSGSGERRHKLPPCCALGCTMLSWAGFLPPPAPRINQFVFSLVATLAPPVLIGAAPQHEAASFRARGPPAST